jgi:hypothetical protein
MIIGASMLSLTLVFSSMLVFPSMPKGDIVGQLVWIVGCH